MVTPAHGNGPFHIVVPAAALTRRRVVKLSSLPMVWLFRIKPLL
jgi:hypothetical protein